MKQNVQRGLKRLGIVAAVLWFGFWSLRAWFAYQDYQTSLKGNYFNRFDFYAQVNWNRFVGSIAAAFLWPLAAIIALLIGRWVWRGFKEQQNDV